MTTFMIAPRQAGKTTWLIEQWVQDPHAVIVTVDANRRDYVAREILRTTSAGVNEAKRRVVTYNDAVNMRGLPTHLLIDDLDILLHVLFPHPVLAITSTGVLA